MDEKKQPPMPQSSEFLREFRREPRRVSPEYALPPPAPVRSTMSVGEIYFILFRHKWKIILLTIAGVLAALLVKQSWPVTYSSEARLMIRYLEETRSPMVDEEDGSTRSTDRNGETIINSELAILTSRDLAEQVAESVGPEKVVAAFDPPVDPRAAGGIINGGLSATSSPESRVVVVKFQHLDRSVVQPVLTQLLEEYKKRHVEIHHSAGLNDNFLRRETDELRTRLMSTERRLQEIKDRAGVLSLEEVKQAYANEMANVRQQIFEADTALAERKAVMEAFATTDADEEIREESYSEYRRVTGHLQLLYQREQQLLMTYTPGAAEVQRIQQQIAEQESAKRELESRYPWLAIQGVAPAGGRGAGQATEQSMAGIALDPVLEGARIKALETRIAVLTEHLGKIRSEAAKVGALELELTDVERKRELELSKYLSFARSLDENRIREALGPGSVSNISIIETPTPPRSDTGKLQKILILLVLGGPALGIGLAFLIELYVDQTVKRGSEVASKLHHPLFLSIPAMGGIKRLRNGRGNRALPAGRKANGTPVPIGRQEAGSELELIPWAAGHSLRPFVDALRNRLIHYFDVNNLTRKPKLVGVTGCGERTGVSTVAAGLAASLSETGDGNVLLVDMTSRQQSPHYFHNGDLKCDAAEALELDKRDKAMARDRLFVVSEAVDPSMAQVLPKRFNHLVPKFRASDYDYIIFDLPPVNQVTPTAQLARHMDMVLMVVEAEKTNSQAAKRAGDMLTESGGNMAVVLNKTKNYVPQRLTEEI